MSDHFDELNELWQGICDREESLGFSALTDTEKVFACVWMLSSEVDNGGFHQFYYNSAGDQAGETVASLEVIGATHTSGLVREANALFPSGSPPRDRDERIQALEALSAGTEERLSELDNEFYKEVDDLDALLYAYIKPKEHLLPAP